MKNNTLSLEQLKTVTISGANQNASVDLVRLHFHPNLWVSRGVLAAIRRRRDRELEALKRDCRRLRGLLRELD